VDREEKTAKEVVRGVGLEKFRPASRCVIRERASLVRDQSSSIMERLWPLFMHGILELARQAKNS
jgi:hypothetical protein